MSMRYIQHLIDRFTPQMDKAREDQKQNLAGGYCFVIDKWAQLERFLILAPKELFLSGWITTAGRQTYGFDGKRYWYADSEDAIWLVGDKRRKELKRVKDEVAETKYLLRFFGFSQAH